jgi:hypothetical protein
MNLASDGLYALHVRLQRGDPQALEQFREDCIPLIRRIVRRALQADYGLSPLTRSIRELWARFESAEAGSQDESSLEQVASRLARLLMKRLGAARAEHEARFPTERAALTTVLP